MYLPEELLTEILVRLPVNSLVRLGWVCKAWRDLIRHPYFVEKHLKKNKKNDASIFFRRYYQMKRKEHTKLEEDLLFTHGSLLTSRRRKSVPYTRAIGSCNGVVCLVKTNMAEVHLCNPDTGEDLRLPRHSLGDKFDGFYVRYGFGFDAFTRDYKFVVIECGQPNVRNHTRVYKLSTNCWSELRMDLKCGRISCDGVFVNGSYHWWTEEYTILTFDFENETFGTIKSPPQSIFYRYMGVVDDSLAICYESGVYDQSQVTTWAFDVWVMTEYGNNESWKKRFSTKLSTQLCLSSFWPVRDLSQLMILGAHQDTSKRRRLWDNRVNFEACLVDREGVEAVRARPMLDIDCGDYISGVFFQPSLVSLRSLSSMAGRDHMLGWMVGSWFLCTLAIYILKD